MAPHQRNKQSSRNAILNSTIGHIVVIVVILICSALDSSSNKKDLTVTWVELPKGTSKEINLGIKKLKTLPRTTIEEQKKLFAAKPKTPKKEMKAPAKKKTKSVKRKKTSKKKSKPRQKKLTAAERKMQDALAKIDKELKQRQAPAEVAQPTIEGEGYEFGTSKTAQQISPADAEYLQYQAKVRSKIINEWIIPPIFNEIETTKKLNSKITVTVDNEGSIISTRWSEKSGDNSFDASALRAVKRASPFPKPPKRLAWEVFNEGFLVEFDPSLKLQ